jgi:glycosyltransferase involved in cell wall biosynthesis
MHAIFLGISGFPFGMAAIQRQKLLAKALLNETWQVTIISPRSIHPSERRVRRIGRVDKILYIYLFNPIRMNNFFFRNLQKLFEPIFETILLAKLKKKYGIDVGIVSNPNSFLTGIKYYLISRILDFKIYFNLVENYIDRGNISPTRKINNFLFNKYGLSFYDAYLPISKNLEESFSHQNKKSYYIPIIVDFELISNIKKIDELEEKYFLFCGSAGYFKSINFLLESFKQISDGNCKLLLITNGTKEELIKIYSTVEVLQLKNKVIFRNSLSSSELYGLYKSALGLLLPLLDTIQDRARFPHKLAEYLASGQIVIANNIGEINFFLQHNESVLFSTPGDIIGFSKNMEWVLNNPVKADKIGKKGQEVCSKTFDYRKISPGFSEFLQDQLN